MKISTKGEYGIRAMLELSQHYGEGYVQSAKIAAARMIPENYLYQLLITLRKAGLVQSRRGPQGGHMLARPPKEITLAEVVRALEGPLAPVTCIQEGVVDTCPYTERCVLKDVWREVTASTRRILTDHTLGKLVERELELEKAAS